MTTRPYNLMFHCPNCNTWQSQETATSRWVRNNPELDSEKGYVFIDQDLWLLLYKTSYGRLYQLLSLIEIKTLGGKLTKAQRDLLWLIDQIMRNRRNTPTKKSKKQSYGTITSAFSLIAGKEVTLRCYGVHVLSLSGLGPEDSKEIIWDLTPIDLETLTRVLRFDLDPDSLKPLDLRKHHLKDRQPTLFPIDDEPIII